MQLQNSITELVKHVLDEILSFCADACTAREEAEKGSAEWHKRTGEILAYARMTCSLSKLEQVAVVAGRRDGRPVANPN